MECRETQFFLQAYWDKELDLARSLEVEHHLQDCPRCARMQRNYQTLQTAFTAGDLHFEPSANFQKRIRNAVRRESRNLPSRAWLSWRWLGAGASLLLASFVIWSVLPNVLVSFRGHTLSQEIVASHVRSLMVNHLTDVVSSDQHTVKPWFNGRLDFSPEVCDLTSSGFPLAGGRLDYLGNRPVAALVYQRRKHLINLFEWPTSSLTDRFEQNLTQQGYNLMHWNHGGMVHWAVSDLNQKELQEFVALFQAHAPTGFAQ